MRHDLLTFKLERKLKGNGDHSQLVTGEFRFLLDGNNYSEEEFRIYKRVKDHALIYFSDQRTPLPTGEFLNSHLYYIVNKDWMPIQVVHDRFMGPSHVTEIYTTNKSTNAINYEFQEKGEVSRTTIPLPPKYQVSTPHMSCALLFISSKKYDPTGTNYHNVLVSNNQWIYKTAPEMRHIILRRSANALREINLHGKKIKTLYYEIFSNENQEKNKEVPIKIFLSEHFCIPYVVEAPGNIRISIKYLQQSEKSNVDTML